MDLVTKLLETGERYPLMLHHAVSCNHIKMVRLFLEQHDGSIDVNAVDNDDQTALIWAFGGYHRSFVDDRRDIVHVLLDYGADLSVSDTNGRTALHLIVTRGDRHLVSRVLPLVDADTIRSIHICDIVDLEVMKMLVAHGLDLRATNSEGSILHIGISRYDLDLVQWGLEQGLSINQQNETGYNPATLPVVLGC
jgi:ankyrin repeat protein